MRPAQKNNRSRGRGNRKSGGGGGNVINRVYDSAGPEGKVRGTPQQIIDKYLSLARDAQTSTSGDRVVAENFLQHAEHYQRLLIQAAAATQEQSRRDATDGGTEFDGDAGDMGPSERPASQPQETEAETAASHEIGGMTMIDSGGGEDLLVVSEDIAESQPRRNGDGRRRRQKVAPVSVETGADEAPEAPQPPQPES